MMEVHLIRREIEAGIAQRGYAGLAQPCEMLRHSALVGTAIHAQEQVVIAGDIGRWTHA